MAPDRTQRDRILADLRAAEEKLFGPGSDSTPMDELRATRERRDRLQEAYWESLPLTPVSRCPIDQNVVTKRMDTFGLDGPWWLSKSNDEPAQGDAHLAAFTGGLDLRAMAPEFLSGVAPKRRQTIVAGPGVPYVIPRLMRQEPVRLVISSMTLFEGNATAYFMTYFSDPRLPAWEGHQQWLRENFYFLDAEGRQRWSTRDDAWDPDLAGWLASAPERIFWIAPDDSGMTLLSGAATCPYVNLPGSHMMQHIQSSRIYELGAPIGEKPANS